MENGFDSLVRMLTELDEEYHLKERGLLGLIVVGIKEGLDIAENKKIDIIDGMKEVFETETVRSAIRKGFEESKDV